jgi:hypothetical protein
MNRPQNSRVQSFDSSGPEGKVRGTANQVYEKYLALARDASSSGDRVMAENFFQHAEHYFRIMVANGQQTNSHHVNGFGDDGLGDDDDGDGIEQRPQVTNQSQPQPFHPHSNPGADRAPQAQSQPQPQRSPQPQSQPQPAAEQRPKTPAELAQAVAANADVRGRGRRPGRPPGRRSPDDAAADA